MLVNKLARIALFISLLMLPFLGHTGSAVPRYNPATGELVLPRVYVGDDEYRVTLRLATTEQELSFVPDQLELISKLAFQDAGKPIATYTLAELKAKVPATDITVIEPHYNHPITYQGFPAKAVLDAVYGPAWRNREEVLMTALDGYQPSIPVQKFIDHTAYITYKAKDYEDFQVIKVFTNNTGPGTFEVADLGPFYLVWENIEDKDAPSGEDFPYQMVAMDLISFAERFPDLAPPEGSDDAVRRGFLQYRQHCLFCHAIKGEGGERGPDLTFITKLDRYADTEALKQFIIAPNSDVMPPLEPELEAGEDLNTVVDEIVAYLQAKAEE